MKGLSVRSITGRSATAAERWKIENQNTGYIALPTETQFQPTALMLV